MGFSYSVPTQPTQETSDENPLLQKCALLALLGTLLLFVAPAGPMRGTRHTKSLR